MADAMCGPSNALQQFKQQTQVDRTLQQDRLTSRHSPAQGFRSHDPNATLLDPEFEAFQAGVGPPVLEQAQPFRLSGGFNGPAQAPSWASDFQRLQISSPQPVHQQQHFQPSPNAANWAQGFREHIAQAAPRAQSSSPSPLAFQQRARGIGNFAYQPSFAPQSFTPTYQSAKGKEPVMADQFDEAAFERAFDQASSDMMAGVEETVQEPQVEENISNTIEQDEARVEAIAEAQAREMLKEAGHEMDISTQEAELQRIHDSDIEFRPEQTVLQEEQTMEQQQHEDDALALTAGELLQKVEHNQTDKFKNSNFLDLMRKLRDREVRVQGDKMVETTANATDMAADGTLNATSSVDTSQRLYYGKPQPVPLTATSVDTRSTEIPAQEQDHDQGRAYPNYPNDGQEVVDLLNERGAVTDDMASPNTSISDMLYGANGSLSSPAS